MTTCKAGIKYSHTEAKNLTSDQASLVASVPYAQAFGSLQYLVTCTNSSLAFPINHLAQFMANHGPHHWNALKHIFYYLQHTSIWGFLYKCPSIPIFDHLLYKSNNTDLAGDIDARQSILGYIFQLHGALRS
jgi:hypothetical protein